MTLLGMLEQTVARWPDRCAVRSPQSCWTFAEVLDRAEHFAGRLRAAGIGPGDRVAIQMQNDPEFLAAQYAIWIRGGIVVPISPMLKEAETAFQMEDSGAKLLLKREDVLPGGTGHPGREPLPDAAYLIYTSGTTGKPKGAICPHRSMLHTGQVFERLFQVSQHDRILGLAPLFHVTGVVAHMALSARTGAALVLMHRFEPELVWRTIERERPTVTVAAITAYIALRNHPLASGERLSTMTKCFTGGAPVSPSFVEGFERDLGVYIHNTYGLTEVNSPSHITPLGERAPVDPASGALSVGRVIPGCEARVLEDGELALRGANVFPGYWNRPDATEAAFRDGWFLTGDIASIDAQGWCYIVDRKKDMINCSGFKVYPREVEDVLYQHPDIVEAAVVGVPDGYRGETVKAFVVRKPGSRATEQDLIAFTRERLAAYKYPRQVVFLDSLPKTATGKFLRRALRDL
jgi:long-chain acyl-CoA synthetase